MVPYIDIDVDDEDSLTDRFSAGSPAEAVDIVVIRVLRISNFTDFNALDYIDGIGVRYVKSARELEEPDMIILPGTKNTMGDLEWLRQSGLEAKIKRYASSGRPVFE